MGSALFWLWLSQPVYSYVRYAMSASQSDMILIDPGLSAIQYSF